MQTSRLSRKGQVTIPGEIRGAMGLGAGDLNIVELGDVIPPLRGARGV